jgi:hypothetical protein
MRIATAGLLLAALVTTSACSNKAATSSSDTNAAAADTTSTVASPADATATPDDSAASPAPASSALTVTTKDGTTTIGGNLDQTKLGEPVYPGAQPDPNAASSMSAQTPQGSTYIGMFDTPDNFDKVYDYYKTQMPPGSEKMKMSMGGASSATWQVGKDGGPDEILVQVNSDKAGKVSILITHVTKNDASPAPAASP